MTALRSIILRVNECLPPDKVKKKIELTIDDPLEPELEEFLPDFDSFSFDTTEEISGNPTYLPNFSYPTYEAFHFDIDHTEETSSGSTTSLALISLPEYDFSFDPGGGALYHKSLIIEEITPTLPPEVFVEKSFNDKIQIK